MSETRTERLKKILDDRVDHQLGFEGIIDKKKDLALVRLACLTRNKLFQFDCKKLRKLKEEKNPNFRAIEKEFFKKWDIDKDGLSLKPENYVKITDTDRYGYLYIKIDLLYPKAKLMQRIGRLIDKHQSEYEEFANDLNYEYDLRSGIIPKKDITLDEQFEQVMDDLKKRKKDVCDKRQLRDIDLYIRYLQIWDLRKAKTSWNNISAILDENNSPISTISGIRNEYKKINKMIEEGIPGFKKFPSK